MFSAPRKKNWSLGVVLQIRPTAHVDLMAWGAIDLDQSLIVVRYMCFFGHGLRPGERFLIF